MELSSELISQFARITNDEPTVNEGSTVYATYRLQGDSAYVQIDGSDTITPVATTAGAKSGDRVTVLIKDHRAIVTGNLSDPSANKSTVDEIGSTLDLGLSGLNDSVRNLNNDVSNLNNGINNLKTDVDLKYTDVNGNIQTLSGQVTGMVASIEDAAKVATNYIEFVDKVGLVIGDLINSTIDESTGVKKLGFNTLIDATSLNMRYNDIVLAKYTADTIYLGYNSTRATINMCGGSLTIDSEYDKDLKLDETKIVTTNDLLSLAVLNTNGSYKAAIRIGAPSSDSILMNGTLYVNAIYDSVAEGSAYLTESSADSKYLGKYETPATHYHSQYYESGDNIYANKLYIQGAGNISGDPNARLAVNSPNQLGYASGSSRKFKHDIKPIENAELDPKHLYDIEVVQFKYNDDYLEENDQRYGIDCIGFIAEQVNEVYPIAADRETGEPRNWEMRYIIPPMLALIQQQKKKLDELESRINELESKEVS